MTTKHIVDTQSACTVSAPQCSVRAVEDAQLFLEKKFVNVPNALPNWNEPSRMRSYFWKKNS